MAERSSAGVRGDQRAMSGLTVRGFAPGGPEGTGRPAHRAAGGGSSSACLRGERLLGARGAPRGKHGVPGFPRRRLKGTGALRAERESARALRHRDPPRHLSAPLATPPRAPRTAFPSVPRRGHGAGEEGLCGAWPAACAVTQHGGVACVSVKRAEEKDVEEGGGGLCVAGRARGRGCARACVGDGPSRWERGRVCRRRHPPPRAGRRARERGRAGGARLRRGRPLAVGARAGGGGTGRRCGVEAAAGAGRELSGGRRAAALHGAGGGRLALPRRRDEVTAGGEAAAAAAPLAGCEAKGCCRAGPARGGRRGGVR